VYLYLTGASRLLFICIFSHGARKEQFMKRFSLKHNFLIFLVALLLATTPAWSQVGTTSIRRVVTDKTGAVIAAATVSLNNVGQALTRETSTSSTGEYEFLALPPGSYTLTVQMRSEERRVGKECRCRWWR